MDPADVHTVPHASGIGCISCSIHQVPNTWLESRAWACEHSAGIAIGIKLMTSAAQCFNVTSVIVLKKKSLEHKRTCKRGQLGGIHTV